MLTTNDLKINIIDLVTKMNDWEKLHLIYKNIEAVNTPKRKLSLEDGVVQIRKNVSFEDLVKEQNYQPITYQEFRIKADKIDWGYTLDELLDEL